MAQIRTLPCMLCRRSLEQREDKNGKPYFVCDECGTQFFIRGVAGKSRLAEIMRQPKAKKLEIESQSLVRELMQVQDYIEEFCEGEQIIPDSADGADIVPFPDWSRGVCDRVADSLNRSAKGR